MIHEVPRYEVSQDGNVRIRHTFKNAGYVVQKFRQGSGSEYVYLFQDGKRYKRSVKTLVGKYWPTQEKENA